MTKDRETREARIVATLASSPADEGAWSELLELEWPFVVSICYRNLRGHEDLARDATLEVFARLVEYRPFSDLKEPDSFRSYLSSVCHNVCMDALRQVISDREFLHYFERETLVTPAAPSVADAVEQKELLERALAELKPEDRELAWRVAQGYSLEEAAQLLGISANNARVRMHRIRQRLRKKFPDAGWKG